MYKCVIAYVTPDVGPTRPAKTRAELKRPWAADTRLGPGSGPSRMGYHRSSKWWNASSPRTGDTAGPPMPDPERFPAGYAVAAQRPGAPTGLPLASRYPRGFRGDWLPASVTSCDHIVGPCSNARSASHPFISERKTMFVIRLANGEE